MKTIGFNCLFLIPGEVGGTEYYTRDLIENFLRFSGEDIEIVIFANSENYNLFTKSFPNARVKLCRVSAKNRFFRLAYEQVLLPIKVMEEQCDVLISPGYWGPFFVPSRHIVVAHDMNWRDMPDDSSLLQRIVQEVMMQLSLLSATRIVVDSDFGLQRLKHHFGQYVKKSNVIQPGLSEKLLDLLKKKTKHPLSGQKYFFCPSAFYSHKKILYLLDLWEVFFVQNPQIQLVIVGRRGKDEKQVVEKIQKLKNIHYFPSVSQEELARWYQHSQVVLFPSIYEGFGFPVFEGLAAGKKIIVGKKRLYPQKYEFLFSEFSFSLVSDVELLLKLAVQKQLVKEVELPRYQKTVHDFIELINNL